MILGDNILVSEITNMAYATGTYFAPITRSNKRNYKLVGYWLSSTSGSLEGSTAEIKLRLDDLCSHQGCILNAVEWDCGASLNPMRMGFWKALRRLVCDKCPPKRMSMSFMNLEDFMTQALAPCSCGRSEGLDGILFTTLKHLTTDPTKASQVILKLAEQGKHVMAEDGVCLSCCHPATKKMLQKRKLLVAS